MEHITSVPADEPETCSMAGAVRITGFPPSTVYELCKRGQIPLGTWYRGGRAIRFNVAKLRAWLAAGGTAAEPDVPQPDTPKPRRGARS